MSGDDHGADDSNVVGFAAGSRIAGYRLEERIGRGTAVVFKARDEWWLVVALKILGAHSGGYVDFSGASLSNCGELAAAIDDPHIVPVFAAGEADGVLIIATRYVAGGRPVAAEPGGPAAAGPGCGHHLPGSLGAGRCAPRRPGAPDAKPSNTLMDVLPGRPDHVYLSDFGLNKAVASTSGMTQAGVVMDAGLHIPGKIGSKPENTAGLARISTRWPARPSSCSPARPRRSAATSLRP